MIRGLEDLSYEFRLRQLRLFISNRNEKASGSSYSSLAVPKGGLQESWKMTFYKDI